LHFPEDKAKRLDQDEVIEILDQVNACDPEGHGAMVNVKIYILNFL
jgi:hypothetical protein